MKFSKILWVELVYLANGKKYEVDSSTFLLSGKALCGSVALSNYNIDLP
jgi:hypothetical protein